VLTPLLCSVPSSFVFAVPQTAGQDPEDMTGTDPEMFMLPLPPGLPGDQYRVKLSYFHPMTFDVMQGKYVLRLPTTVPAVSAQVKLFGSVLYY
jgi:hypothetical protein